MNSAYSVSLKTHQAKMNYLQKLKEEESGLGGRMKLSQDKGSDELELPGDRVKSLKMTQF